MKESGRLPPSHPRLPCVVRPLRGGWRARSLYCKQREQRSDGEDDDDDEDNDNDNDNEGKEEEEEEGAERVTCTSAATWEAGNGKERRAHGGAVGGGATTRASNASFLPSIDENSLAR